MGEVWREEESGRRKKEVMAHGGEGRCWNFNFPGEEMKEKARRGKEE